MAGFYRVPLAQYLRGQEWARENLPRLRCEAGLDPDTGLPAEPTNGAEPQPAATPAQPAPRRNNHRLKASMAAHRAPIEKLHAPRLAGAVFIALALFSY